MYAPLIAATPRSLDITIPCSTLRELPADGAVVLSTMPTAALQAKAKALSVTAGREAITVTFRNTLAASAPRSDLTGCSRLHIWSSTTATGARFLGLGSATDAGDLGADRRPQIDGMFTNLSAAATAQAITAGLHARVEIDNRYESSPSALKLIVMVLAACCVVLALLALRVMDHSVALTPARRQRPSPGHRSRWRPRLSDLVVGGASVIWLFFGAGSPDDGYILNMGRTADSFGYLANYYRFYGIPEAPFDWYYSFLSHWSALSASLLWMHIPQLVAALCSWLILSRVLPPRLGTALAPIGRGWPNWAAALVFLAFWLPCCSGLRSEPMIVLGSLLTWWAAERAIATHRLVPAAVAAIIAGLTMALAPHGVIAPAILIVSARSLLRVVLSRRARMRPATGHTQPWLIRWLSLSALLLPIIAAGLLVLVVIFRDQSLATVYEAVKMRYLTGPVIDWYQEYMRYYFISVTTKDGALTRRVPVLLLFAALFVVVAVMLRRNKINGINPGPAWRLIGAIGVTLVLFAFTPTKWTIQFGVFAGLGAAIAAVATIAVVQAAATSTRNLTVFVAGLFFALAAAMAGKNAWPFAYEYGISWFDRAPVVGGFAVSTPFLVLAVVTVAVAVWQHLRLDYVDNTGLVDNKELADHPGSGVPASGARASASDRRRLFLASSPIAVIAALMVVAELLVFVKAAAVRYPATTVLGENLDTLRGNACGMADQVLVESNPNAGMLSVADGATASQALAGTDSANVGFSPNAVPDDLFPEPGSARPGQMNVAAPFSQPFVVSGGLGAGTTGGRGPTTVNGSTVALPYGLNPDTTPVLGSYGFNGQARLTTDWYNLPARNASPLLVFSAAGSISSIDMFGVRVYGQSIVVQFGTASTADGSTGFTQIGPDVLPLDPGPIIPNMPWRNLRVPMTAVPPAAKVMRLVLVDSNLGADQFLAITPPRAPKLATLQQVVGSDAPTLIDFTAASHFPCQQPLRVPHGVAEVPQWRILPDYVSTNSQSKTWQDADAGGLLAISSGTTTAQAVPTYLKDDWYQGWGALERLTPLDTRARPAVVDTTPTTQWGWERTGSIRVEPSNEK